MVLLSGELICQYDGRYAKVTAVAPGPGSYSRGVYWIKEWKVALHTKE